MVAGAAFGGWYFFLRSREPEFTYRTAPVERGRVVARVTATGTLSAYVTVLVGSQVSGRVSQINVDFNSPVKKGQLIAKIDPQIFEAALAQARANLFAAQGNLSKARAQATDAERQLARSRSLHAEGLLAQVGLDTAETNLAVAKAQIEASKGAMEQARAAVHQAEINLAYTNIASPIDGVVISRSVDVGQTVAASLQAPTLFTIAQDLRKMQVDTNIAEGDVGKLRPEMAATFLVDAYPNERFKGSIRQIRNAPQTVQNVVTYDAVIDVDNADLKLKPGMTANVTMVYAERDAVLTVPNTALRFRPPPALSGSAESGPGSGRGSGRRREAGAPPSASPPGSGAPAPTAETSAAAVRGGPRGEPSLDRRSVWVVRGPKPERVPVRVGLTDGTVTEILEGDLKEGDALVLEATSSDEPNKKPSDGAPPRLRL
jgi:HlyD family secretion protein